MGETNLPFFYYTQILLTSFLLVLPLFLFVIPADANQSFLNPYDFGLFVVAINKVLTPLAVSL